jgi:hypothetical protein
MVDQFEELIPDGFALWMEKQIERADFVIMVCTEQYYRRVMKEEDPGKGLGVCWEAHLIRRQLYENNTRNERFIPVLFAGGSTKHIPLPLRDFPYCNLDSQNGYETLYRLITRQPRIKKVPLGPLRRLLSIGREPTSMGTVLRRHFLAIPHLNFRPALLLPFRTLADESVWPENVEAKQTLEHIVPAWLNDASSDTPLVIAPHFGSDIPACLLAVNDLIQGVRHYRPCWTSGRAVIDGLANARPEQEVYLDPVSPILPGIVPGLPVSESVRADAMDSLSGLDPTLFLIDFSGIPHEVLFSQLRLRENTCLADLGKALVAFSSWAGAHRHRTVLGVSRFLLGLFRSRSTASFSQHVYAASGLFRQEPVTGNSETLHCLLQRLRSTNSITLPTIIDAFVSRLQETDLASVSRLPPAGLSSVIRFARELTEGGFYEIAYRLELWVRTRGHDQLVSLASDLDLHDDSEDAFRIRGLVDDVTTMPAVVSRATLIGPAGAGKTSALLQILRRWAVPQFGDRGVAFPTWVPIYLTLGKTVTLALAEEVSANLREQSDLEIGIQGQRNRLPCHSLLAESVELATLPWIFSSPLYLLADGLDEMRLDYCSAARRELARFLREFPRIGALLTHRSGDLPDSDDFKSAFLRPLDANQLKAFLDALRVPDALRDFITGEQALEHLPNPYLLTLICVAKPSLSGTDLNLSGILKAFAEGLLTSAKALTHSYLLETWLPEIGINLKKSGLTSRMRKNDGFSAW